MISIYLRKYSYENLLLTLLLMDPLSFADAKLKQTMDLAKLGNVNSQFNLGAMYDHGEGVSENHAEVVRWF